MPWLSSKRQASKSNAAFDAKATEQDIFFCFRLLLGREPNPEERRGHMMRVGEDLAGVVASYLGSLEFSRRRLLQSDAETQLGISDAEGFRIYSALDDAAIGKYVRAGNYERHVTAVFRNLVRDGMYVVDIGANIGYFSLLSAVLVGARGHVVAVEPNPRNVRLLEASRRVNDFSNMTILQMAAGRCAGLLSLHTSHSNGTTSDLGAGVQAPLDTDMVFSLHLDAILAGGRKVDFIKIDVEGAEYNALLGCQETIVHDRPIIVSEFSPNLMPGISGISGEAYLQWLMSLGYVISVIESDGSWASGVKVADTILHRHATSSVDHIDIVAIPD